MPFATSASAVWWINASLTLQPNEFQSSQPIGGVRATPLSSAQDERALTSSRAAATSNTAPDWIATRLVRVGDRRFRTWKTPAGDMMALLLLRVDQLLERRVVDEQSIGSRGGLHVQRRA